jgi:hypothetical protein
MENREDLVIQNGELFGKGRAELRNEQLIQLIREWEKQRDELLDEIAHSKGKVEILEALVKQSYERIIEVNKEEQAKEQALINSRFQDLQVLAEAEQEKLRNVAVAERHKKKQEDVKSGKVKPKPHPSERGRDLSKRKAEARKKKEKKKE